MSEAVDRARASFGELHTARLVLRPLGPPDAEALAALLADPALHAWTGGSPDEGPAEVRAQLERWELAVSPDGTQAWLNWGLRAIGSEELIGHLQATVGARDATLAWVVEVRSQGQGYASEAASAVSSWLRDLLPGQVLRACIAPGHEASERVAARAGLHPTEQVDDGEVVWSSA